MLVLVMMIRKSARICTVSKIVVKPWHDETSRNNFDACGGVKNTLAVMWAAVTLTAVRRRAAGGSGIGRCGLGCVGRRP